MAALYPVDLYSDRSLSYPHYSMVLNFDDIVFPMTLRKIARFERFNELSINVFAIQEKRERNGIMVVPLSLMGNKKSVTAGPLLVRKIYIHIYIYTWLICPTLPILPARTSLALACLYAARAVSLTLSLTVPHAIPTPHRRTDGAQWGTGLIYPAGRAIETRSHPAIRLLT
ncbi:hypothetical protein P5V15_010251 [Pogonomyrmex californicus]